MKPANSGLALVLPVSIAVLSLLMWSPTLGCFFFADDLYCLNYLYRIFNGEPALALVRLGSSWMDEHILLVYRPFGDLTLFADYFFWRANPVGYHLTNISLNAAAAVFVYLNGLELLRPAGLGRSHANDPTSAGLTSALAAVLFIVTPLHIEPVCWIVGRLDLLCSLFYLVSFWCGLRWIRLQRRGYLVAALVSFVMAVLSKETAVTLPVVLVLWSLLLSPKALVKTGKLALSMCAITGIYVIIRTQLLGALVGGYQGTYGNFLHKSLLTRLNPGTLKLFLIPLNNALWDQGGKVDVIFRVLYLMTAAFLFWRIPYFPWTLQRLRLLTFLAVFALLTVAPALPAFLLTDTMVGSRMLYLAGAPLSLLLVCALLPLQEAHGWRVRRLVPVAVVLILAFSIVCAFVSVKDFETWKYAGEALKSLRRQVAEAIQNNPGKKILVVNLPTNYHGAHMCYETAEATTLMGPAFGQDLSKSLVYLEPKLSDLASNLQRLSLLLADQSVAAFKFDLDKMQLTACPPLFGHQKRLPNGKTILPGMNLSLYRQSDRSFVIDVQPWEAHSSLELLKLTIVATCKESSPYLKLSVINDGRESPDSFLLPIKADAKEHTYSLPVAAQKLWLLAEQKAHLLLELDTNEGSFDVLKVEPVPFGNTPGLRFSEQIAQGPDGVCFFKNGHGEVQAVTDLATEILMFEISKPFYSFDFPGDMQRDAVPSEYAHQRLTLRRSAPGRFTLKIARSDFPKPARYQIRACAMTAEGKLYGYFCDPLSIDLR